MTRKAQMTANHTMTKTACFFLPALIWGVIIFMIISLPSSALPPTEVYNIPHFDKIVHFTMYAIFGVLMLFGFGRFKRNAEISHKHLIISITTGVFYGILTEFLQHCCFDDRHGNIYDVAANVFGTVFGVVLIVALNKNRK